MQIKCSQITNWAGNIEPFTPRVCYEPDNDAEVLAILKNHGSGHIRVVGSRHSMNDIARTDDVSIDMKRFANLSVDPKTGPRDGAERTVTAGAGITLEALQNELDKVGATLPARGTIKLQTVAGAISTGTHGSGKSSLSHHVTEVRVAAYDQSGEPKVFVFSQGDELQAARTALGAMGVILDVKIRAPRRYFIEQSLDRAESLKDVLKRKQEYPMQLFIRLPYDWNYYVSRRRESLRGPQGLRENLDRYARRILNRVVNDRLLPLLIKHVVAPRSSRCVQCFYEKILPRVILEQGPIIDDDDHVQTMHHEFPTNQDIELFVPESRFCQADEWLKEMIIAFENPRYRPPQEIMDTLEEAGLVKAFASRQSYTQHAPLFYQRVMPDDTLISMTAGAAEPYYSILVLSYLPPRSSQGFAGFAKFIGEGLARIHQGRAHWGKYFPLNRQDIEPRYPNLDKFRQICRKYDPNGVFRNDFTARALG